MVFPGPRDRFPKSLGRRFSPGPRPDRNDTKYLRDGHYVFDCLMWRGTVGVGPDLGAACTRRGPLQLVAAAPRCKGSRRVDGQGAPHQNKLQILDVTQ